MGVEGELRKGEKQRGRCFTPVAVKAATSEILTPGRYSRVSTVGDVCCQLTTGARTQSTSLKFLLNLHKRAVHINIPSVLRYISEH